MGGVGYHLPNLVTTHSGESPPAGALGCNGRRDFRWLMDFRVPIDLTQVWFDSSGCRKRGASMRLSSAIIAAIMSVMTAGPSCRACQLASLLRAGSSPRADQPRAESPAPERRCKCKSHGEIQNPPPAEKERGPRPPCNHGPALELAAVTSWERVSDGSELTSDCADAVGEEPNLLVPIASGRATRYQPATDLSGISRLRYSHSFRC